MSEHVVHGGGVPPDRGSSEHQAQEEVIPLSPPPGNFDDDRAAEPDIDSALPDLCGPSAPRLRVQSLGVPSSACVGASCSSSSPPRVVDPTTQRVIILCMSLLP